VTENLLTDLLTPAHPAEVFTALRAAWDDSVDDTAPNRASILVLLSQWALETGFGHACHRWNLGNAKHVPGDGHEYVMFACSEIISGVEVWFQPPARQTWFVAFESLSDGAEYYLRSLRKQFASAWPAVIAANPAEFAHLLKLSHYYTASEALYVAGLMRCYRQLDVAIPPDDPATPITVDPAAGEPPEVA
jgi:hypothetical protein